MIYELNHLLSPDMIFLNFDQSYFLIFLLTVFWRKIPRLPKLRITVVRDKIYELSKEREQARDCSSKRHDNLIS